LRPSGDFPTSCLFRLFKTIPHFFFSLFHQHIISDPHFSTWANQRFNYHGACDLVLLHAPEFQGDKSIDVHVRTVSESIYSIIAAVGIKVADSVFSFHHENLGFPQIFIDGVEVTEIPDGGHEQGPFRVTTSTLHEEKYDKNVMEYIITLGGSEHDKITIHVMDQFVFVNAGFAATSLESGTSGLTGLAGSYPDGKMLGRDGSDMSHDRNAYGSDWQVQEDEPKLFYSTPEGFPQAPDTKCKLPEIDAHEYLRTANAEMYQVAVKACEEEGVKGNFLDDCVFDVVVLSKPEIAAAWWGSSQKTE